MSMQLGGYTELRELGSGASGRVVVARYDATGQLVAIKHLASALAADLEFRARFRQEAAVLGRVRHPNVVALYGYQETATEAAILMELLDGVALEKITERGPVEPEAALVMLSGALLGLDAAHRMGIVHRDVKPANILVETAGGSHLVDFGIAVASGELDAPAGTPAYMAPEQWQRVAAAPSSDVYAATAVFYECVTGRRPFAGDTMAALRLQHRTAQPEVGGFPQPIANLVLRGMAKEPSQRPATAGAFAEELERAAVEVHGGDWRKRGLILLGGAAGLFGALFPMALLRGQGAPGTIAGSAGGVGQAVASALPSSPATGFAPVASVAATVGKSAAGVGAKMGLIWAAVAIAAVVGGAVGIAAATKTGPFGSSTPASSSSPGAAVPPPPATASRAATTSPPASTAPSPGPIAGLGRNLIVNSDAEQGPGSPDGRQVASIPGWTTTGNFTVNHWNITAAGFMQAGDPGPPDRGANYFSGGPDNAQSSATQTVDLSAQHTAISRGATFNASAWLGGFAEQGDAMTVAVDFLDAAGTSVGKVALGPVTNTMRANRTGLMLQSTTGPVPPAAARVVITMTAVRLAGSFNDGYADDLVFQINAS